MWKDSGSVGFPKGLDLNQYLNQDQDQDGDQDGDQSQCQVHHLYHHPGRHLDYQQNDHQGPLHQSPNREQDWDQGQELG